MVRRQTPLCACHSLIVWSYPPVTRATWDPVFSPAITVLFAYKFIKSNSTKDFVLKVLKEFEGIEGRQQV